MLSPIICGTFFGTRALAGLLSGALVSGVQMAVSMSNTGGAWDNAKKYIEVGVWSLLRQEYCSVNVLLGMKNICCAMLRACLLGCRTLSLYVRPHYLFLSLQHNGQHAVATAALPVIVIQFVTIILCDACVCRLVPLSTPVSLVARVLTATRLLSLVTPWATHSRIHLVSGVTAYVGILQQLVASQ
jgi:hypothetical protein